MLAAVFRAISRRWLAGWRLLVYADADSNARGNLDSLPRQRSRREAQTVGRRQNRCIGPRAVLYGAGPWYSSRIVQGVTSQAIIQSGSLLGPMLWIRLGSSCLGLTKHAT